MVLYLNLFLGHLLGDFVLQPGRLVVAKRNGAPGLLGHVSIVTAATAVVLFSELGSLWWVVAYVAAAHLVIEVVSIRARHDRSARGLFVFALDQTLHVASLVVPVLLLGGWIGAPHTSTFGAELEVGRLAAVAAMATVVFLGAILVFEAAEAADPQAGGAILPFDGARVLGMAERGVALAAALLAGPALLAVPFLPRALLALRLPPQDRLRQMTIAATGLVLCAASYAIAAAVTAAAGRM